ncbi:proteasome subunit beta type-6-like [Drosophila miranda]|uniref:proteasome subunit beta type-6-like n=1 Tax=Drosophila miranda TaxID=7229 RepID=UPI00143F985C|nr:proteasome subunit beta type-6-like [Drosophila miranda]
MWHCEMHTGEQTLVRDGAAEFRDKCYDGRKYLYAGIIVGGWDDLHGAQVYNISLGGMMMREQLSYGGSGSIYISGMLRDGYRPNMEKEELVLRFRSALKQAIHHDSFSGGVSRIAIINKEGIERRVYYNTSTGKAQATGTDVLLGCGETKKPRSNKVNRTNVSVRSWEISIANMLQWKKRTGELLEINVSCSCVLLLRCHTFIVHNAIIKQF